MGWTEKHFLCFTNIKLFVSIQHTLKSYILLDFKVCFCFMETLSYKTKNVLQGCAVCSKELNITPAALSYHLKLLKGADLVAEYKEKNFIYYEINTTVFDELIMWVEQFGGRRQ